MLHGCLRGKREGGSTESERNCVGQQISAPTAQMVPAHTPVFTTAVHASRSRPAQVCAPARALRLRHANTTLHGSRSRQTARIWGNPEINMRRRQPTWYSVTYIDVPGAQAAHRHQPTTARDRSAYRRLSFSRAPGLNGEGSGKITPNLLLFLRPPGVCPRRSGPSHWHEDSYAVQLCWLPFWRSVPKRPARATHAARGGTVSGTRPATAGDAAPSQPVATLGP